jgi:hypothetical protein
MPAPGVVVTVATLASPPDGNTITG